jgi:DNA-3-methyladenine glycosylase
MANNNRLGREFYARSTLLVARELLGMRLVKIEGKARIAGLISETEAYVGETDQGCHARAGLTRRTQVMYGPSGHSYIYFTYGMHWMLNIVTEREGFPAAVLIRAIEPIEGLEVIANRRNGRPPNQWTDGPAKLCQALGIDAALHGVDLCVPGAELFVEIGDPIPDESVTIGPRVGLNNVPEPWKSIPWRFKTKLLEE